jgi:hypothetical protein
MKRQVYTTTILILFVVLIGVTRTDAQTRLTANVPFNFNVGGKILPAGHYSISFINTSSDKRVLQLVRSEGGAAILIQTTDVVGKPDETAKLEFNRYGNQYFFAQVWLPSDGIGMQARKSEQEKRIARQLIPLRLSRETVALMRR